ncbi:hypothetical protein QWI29_14610 [Mycolicibacterium neoaurum]|uniref:hypothetical protein n=1 Tax=Mycolicibacterium neoaurum TaxID=1795 RepID=UPI0026740E70|nr:hypothetical protein [Mycolicibacterium neoaurum]MDO3401269.1 hypothetical protein [Mycolicibacterium neoaurum]
MTDDLGPLTTAEQREHARAHARSRYGAYLEEVLTVRGVADPAGVAAAALSALTEWPDIETGELCRCSCHPQLPNTDLHDFGFDCTCARTRDQRRESFQQLLNGIDEYWQSPEGLQIRAADEAAEQELQDWLAHHPGVVVHSHGGWAPEQWYGTVDGHSFYFRERGGDWDLEIDLRPTGQSMRTVDGQDDDGTTRYRQVNLERGDIIASGTIYADDYGSAPAERARFIVSTIRDHLTRAGCTHYRAELDAISAVIGTTACWCAGCGARLSALSLS